jgi:hypothetical protein
MDGEGCFHRREYGWIKDVGYSMHGVDSMRNAKHLLYEYMSLKTDKKYLILQLSGQQFFLQNQFASAANLGSQDLQVSPHFMILSTLLLFIHVIASHAQIERHYNKYFIILFHLFSILFIFE